VGHPLFDELPLDRAGRNGERFPQRAPVIGLLPGSRTSEAQQNLPHLLDVAAKIRAEFKDASFVVPTTVATDPVAEESVRKWPGLPVEIGRDQFDEMVPRCDLCLTVSGTATLHVAGFGVPMIVVYRSNTVQWNAGGRWLIRTRTFALVNLLANKGADALPAAHVVPEFVPWYGSNVPLANAALQMLREPERLEQQREKLRALIASLDHPGASDRTAAMALEMIAGGKRASTD
jgi:lipid-A-disaccharide synthase